MASSQSSLYIMHQLAWWMLIWSYFSFRIVQDHSENPIQQGWLGLITTTSADLWPWHCFWHSALVPGLRCQVKELRCNRNRISHLQHKAEEHFLKQDFCKFLWFLSDVLHPFEGALANVLLHSQRQALIQPLDGTWSLLILKMMQEILTVLLWIQWIGNKSHDSWILDLEDHRFFPAFWCLMFQAFRGVSLQLSCQADPRKSREPPPNRPGTSNFTVYEEA